MADNSSTVKDRLKPISPQNPKSVTGLIAPRGPEPKSPSAPKGADFHPNSAQFKNYQGQSRSTGKTFKGKPGAK